MLRIFFLVARQNMHYQDNRARWEIFFSAVHVNPCEMLIFPYFCNINLGFFCVSQIPVACKSCPCGYVFISRKLLNAKLNERSPPALGRLMPIYFNNLQCKLSRLGFESQDYMLYFRIPIPLKRSSK